MSIPSTRRWLANSLRDKVVGEGAEDKARAIWLAQGERWFRETDAVWRVHDDASMFVGGLRALLLQSLHPLAMAGVAGHSGYRSDPWGRLQRTSEFLAKTTFGTAADAEAAVARVRGIHERVRGRAEDGRPYAASDPHLLAWVHAAEADSFLAAYRKFGSSQLTAADAEAAVARVRGIHERVRGRAEDGRAYAASDPHLLAWVHAAEADSFLAAYRKFGSSELTAADEDDYVAQSGTIAARLGVVDPPRSVAELTATLDAYRPELQGSSAAHEAARFLLLHPPLSWVERPGYACLAAAAVALLPVWAKEMLRLPVLPVTERTVTLPVGALAVNAVRWALTDPRHSREDLRREWREANPTAG